MWFENWNDWNLVVRGCWNQLFSRRSWQTLHPDSWWSCVRVPVRLNSFLTFFCLHTRWVHSVLAVVSDWQGVGDVVDVCISVQCTYSACQKQCRLRSGAGMLSICFRSLSITSKQVFLTLISVLHHVVNSCTTSSKVCIPSGPSGFSAKIEMSSMKPML